ncbi:hypothetical protein Scep_023334 [Stephania cephalantha]|uniref:Uncharacterized protein n=1 Tax=Stephania cephalantha TaxID=152367 RepID=A0AAP0EUZ2_9MAGN
MSSSDIADDDDTELLDLSITPPSLNSRSPGRSLKLSRLLTLWEPSIEASRHLWPMSLKLRMISFSFFAALWRRLSKIHPSMPISLFGSSAPMIGFI